MRLPGLEPGSQAWKAGVLPLYQKRFSILFYFLLFIILFILFYYYYYYLLYLLFIFNKEKILKNWAPPGIEPGPPAPKAGILPLNYKASVSLGY